MDFETRAIHEGQEPDPATGAIITPIYQTSTFVQDAVGEHKGYDYARVANPTRTALQIALASLENATHGIAFSSGLGATTTRSEEHTSELQSRLHLVCRLLLEKKKKTHRCSFGYNSYDSKSEITALL